MASMASEVPFKTAKLVTVRMPMEFVPGLIMLKGERAEKLASVPLPVKMLETAGPPSNTGLVAIVPLTVNVVELEMIVGPV